jgi:hypothetical protein
MASQRKISKSQYLIVLGKEVYRRGKFNNSSFNIQPRIKESGIYFYRIYNDGELVGTGKLIRE